MMTAAPEDSKSSGPSQQSVQFTVAKLDAGMVLFHVPCVLTFVDKERHEG